MTIMAPKDGEEFKRMLWFALEHTDGAHAGPIAVRYPRGAAKNIDWGVESAPLEWGKAETLMQGADIAYLAIGSMVQIACEAAKHLREEGINASVVNARFVRPLDTDLILNVARKTGKLILAEENVKKGGFGSAVMELLADNDVSNVKIKHIGVPDHFIEHGTPDILKQVCGLDVENLVHSAHELLDSERYPILQKQNR